GCSRERAASGCIGSLVRGAALASSGRQGQRRADRARRQALRLPEGGSFHQARGLEPPEASPDRVTLNLRDHGRLRSARLWVDLLIIRTRSEEHTSELQSQSNLVCRLLLEKKKKNIKKLQYHK